VVPLIRRRAAEVVPVLLAGARVVVLHGARQVGKSTLVRDLLGLDTQQVLDLDDPLTRDALNAEGEALLRARRQPVVIDEFQRAGEPLILALKRIVDRDRRRGQFLLTGSANYLASRRPAETLAGRNIRMTLWPLSQGEIDGTKETFVARLVSGEVGLGKLAAFSPSEMLRRVCRGGYPEMVTNDLTSDTAWRWAASYVADCTEREALAGVADVRSGDALRTLMTVLAARTASELVMEDARRDLGASGFGLDPRTVAGHVELLDALHLVHRLPAWSTNAASRVRKHPKVHVVDTGIATAIMQLDDMALGQPAHAKLRGALLESFVVNELAKQASWMAVPPTLWHFRSPKAEIDVIIEGPRRSVVGVEVKAGPASVHDARHLAWMRDATGDRFRAGVVLHGGDGAAQIGDRLWLLPISALWS
jgi:uncharacterized protein